MKSDALIRAVLQALEWSQAQLAAYLGCSPQIVNKWLRAPEKHKPSAARLRLLAQMIENKDAVIRFQASLEIREAEKKLEKTKEKWRKEGVVNGGKKSTTPPARDGA